MNFFKKLFTKQDDKAIEEQIEKQYIFVELELEHWYEPFYADNVRTAAGPDLNSQEYASIHQLLVSGATVIPHITSDTSIEFFVQSAYVDFAKVERTGIAVRHAYSTYDAIIMDVVMWMEDGSVATLPFKLNIRPEDEKSRLTSALISVQKEIPFYFGRVEDGVFTIEKRLLAKIPDSVQNDQQILLAELYMDANRKSAPFIEMGSVSDMEMTTAGWVWHFDNEKMNIEELDLSLMKIDVLRTIFEKTNSFSDKGYYTGWVAENVADPHGTGPYSETTTFILTSSEPLHSKEKLHSEIMNYLQSVAGYLREDGGYPLKYESIPILRRGENGFGFTSLDEEFLTRADELYKRLMKDPDNLYRKLLDMK